MTTPIRTSSTRGGSTALCHSVPREPRATATNRYEQRTRSAQRCVIVAKRAMWFGYRVARFAVVVLDVAGSTPVDHPKVSAPHGFIARCLEVCCRGCHVSSSRGIPWRTRGSAFGSARRQPGPGESRRSTSTSWRRPCRAHGSCSQPTVRRPQSGPDRPRCTARLPASCS